MNSAPAKGDHQRCTLPKLPKVLIEDFSRMLSRGRQTCADINGILARFLEKFGCAKISSILLRPG